MAIIPLPQLSRSHLLCIFGKLCRHFTRESKTAHAQLVCPRSGMFASASESAFLLQAVSQDATQIRAPHINYLLNLYRQQLRWRSLS